MTGRNRRPKVRGTQGQHNTVQFRSIRRSRVTGGNVPKYGCCHRSRRGTKGQNCDTLPDMVILAKIRAFCRYLASFGSSGTPCCIFHGKPAQSNTKISRCRATPDEIRTLSRPPMQGDEMKISSGVSQSRRGDKSIEIVQ